MEEKKPEFNSTKYKRDYASATYDRVTVFPQKGTKEKWKKLAERHGMSLNALVTTAVDEFLERHEL